MLSELRIRLHRRLPDERGWTLIELLVVLVAGIVVMSALLTILEVTARQTNRTFSKVDATQRARTMLERLEGELHSACVVNGTTPVQAGSTSTTLSFLSYYGDTANPTPSWHNIVFSGGTLTDNAYAVGGSSPNWTQGSLQSSTTLLNNVSQSGSTPVFQYFSFQQIPNGQGGYYSDGAGNPYMILADGTNPIPNTSPAIVPAASPLSTPLSSTDSQNATEVRVTLAVGPGGGTEENTNLSDANTTINDGITLRLTPPANHVESGANFGPCQ
jgi:type II secretory pathway pseudopilin PulG